MRRPSALTIFVLSAFGWIVALTLLWSQVSAWTSYPVGVLSHIALEQGAPMWVREVRLKPGVMDVDTRVAIPVPSAGGRRAEVTIDVNPARYAYGLPIFLALLLAARGPRRLMRGVVGYLVLLPAQAFSLSMYALMQLVLAAQVNARLLRIAPWQLELLVYGYQVGSLVVPTLAPILVWLWLDRQFVAKVVVPAWKPLAPASPPAADPS
ncbi:MAG: hypothetical protein KA749_02370 [Acidovorax sp.]|nr:hypothetical protein [Acidovorax sp.]